MRWPPMPSMQAIKGNKVVQGSNTVAGGNLKLATLRYTIASRCLFTILCMYLIATHVCTNACFHYTLVSKTARIR